MSYEKSNSRLSALASVVVGLATLAALAFVLVWLAAGAYALPALLFGWPKPSLPALGLVWAYTFIVTAIGLVLRTWIKRSSAAIDSALNEEARPRS